ncbi:MAG: hypothetical protein ACK5LC_07850 [Coprobacillaceae bacterium]
MQVKVKDQIISTSGNIAVFSAKEQIFFRDTFSISVVPNVNTLTLELHTQMGDYIFSIGKIAETEYTTLLSGKSNNNSKIFIDKQSNSLVEATDDFIKIINFET